MRRRPFTVFSLSFLDCICCGFGAVILLFVLMNARATQTRREETKDLRGEVSRMEVEVLKLEKEKVLARNALEEVVEELAETEGLSKEIIRQINESEEELAKREGETLATKEHVNQLKTDLLSLEEGVKRLKAGAASEEPGEKLLEFLGDGDRQYLTGLKLTGNRTLVLVDVSASMLAEQVVDVIRIRNLPEAERSSAPKWVRTRRTVEWILSQLPSDGTCQVALYHDGARPLLDRSGWWDAADPTIRKEAADVLEQVIPSGGTSLELAFRHAASLEPRPDNIILLADGLPTMGTSAPIIRKTVGGDRRLALFREAAGQLPAGVPVNVLLFYMEGDPLASVAYWGLGIQTRGSFLTVTEDWP